MASGMPYDRARQRLIRSNIAEQEQSAGGVERLPHEKLIVKGQAKRQPVYRFSLSDLAFNKANGRIAAEVMDIEAELGRQLDLDSDEDQKIIKSLLLSIRQDENEKIRGDLQKNGQLRPGIVTCDGIVINGNRRKAILEELYETTHDEQFRYLDVQVLPSDITKAELWLIEAGLQMSAAQQLDYSPINHLLKLREGVTAGLQIADMASRIYGVSEDRIGADLDRLQLIDQYLRDFLGKPDRYYLVRQLNEHFIDLQDILTWAKRPRGNVPLDWSPTDSDRAELVNVAFLFIRARFAHMRIRELRDIFATKAAWLHVRRALDIELKLTAEDRRLIGLPDLQDDEDVIEVESGEETTERPIVSQSVIEDQDIREETAWKDANRKKLEVHFGDAKEQRQIERDRKRPLELARRALRMVKAIPSEGEFTSEPEFDDVLREIISQVNDLRKAFARKELRRKPAKQRGKA